jgi:ABC-2 type transport system permease protein
VTAAREATGADVAAAPAASATVAAGRPIPDGGGGPPGGAAAAGGAWAPALALTRRELVRFFRQKGRVVGAIGTPLFVWLFLGFGLGHRFQAAGPGGQGYLAYFFPGMVSMIVLFTAIFSAISVIQDRTEGFLQAVLVAPVPRVSIVLGKVLGGTLIATAQGVAVLALAPLAGAPFHALGYALAVVVVAVMAIGLSGLGFAFAWRTTSVQAFHAVMNLILFPMWMLSGAFFPPEGWLGWIMLANPLTYALAALRRAVFLGAAAGAGGADAAGPSLALGLAVSAAFAAAMLALGAARVGRAER